MNQTFAELHMFYFFERVDVNKTNYCSLPLAPECCTSAIVDERRAFILMLTGLPKQDHAIFATKTTL